MRKLVFAFMLLILGISTIAGLNSTTQKIVELTPLNTIVLRGEVSKGSVYFVMNELIRLNSLRVNPSDYPIYLVIDSPGGSIIDGEELIEMLKNIPNVYSITIFSASMAQHIAQAVTGQRYVTETGTFMDHRASGTFSGQFGEGEVESRLAWIKSLVKIISTRTANRLGISVEEYEKNSVNEWWNVGLNALESGHADSVVSFTCSKDLLDLRITVFTRTLVGNSEEVFSACPLFREALN